MKNENTTQTIPAASFARLMGLQKRYHELLTIPSVTEYDIVQHQRLMLAYEDTIMYPEFASEEQMQLYRGI
jgi:hypothetical protein